MDRAEAIQRQVKGFLEPVFIGTGPDGRRFNGLDPESFQLVTEGYACAECLAQFDTYTITCPVCGTTRDLGRDIAEAPALWNEHIAERNRSEPTPRRQIDPAAEIFRMGMSPDVEQIPLSKLKKRRRG